MEKEQKNNLKIQKILIPLYENKFENLEEMVDFPRKQN